MKLNDRKELRDFIIGKIREDAAREKKSVKEYVKGINLTEYIQNHLPILKEISKEDKEKAKRGIEEYFDKM